MGLIEYFECSTVCLILITKQNARPTHLLDDGREPAQGEPVAVLPGDDGAAHLDDDPLGALQLVPVENDAVVLGRQGAQRDLVVGGADTGVRPHREGAELANCRIGGAGVKAAVEHPSL